MTIHNQLLSDTMTLDLSALIKKYGAPHFPTKRNPVGTLNEVFWSAFFATLNEILYENREGEFYGYGGKIYDPTSEHLLREQLTNDILRASQEWPGYLALSQLCNARHLGGVLTHLKGMTQMEGVFSRPREYIHVANGVIELNGASPKLVGFDPKFYSRNLIPIDYKPGAKCPKFIEQLLKPLPADDVLVLQKLFGMFVSGINFLQKILILQGAPGSGKSQLAAVARLLIGPVNCTELRTAHLGDRFELARYMSKILLIGADVAGDFLNQPGAQQSQEDDRRRHNRLGAEILQSRVFDFGRLLHPDHLQLAHDRHTRRRPRRLVAPADHPELTSKRRTPKTFRTLRKGSYGTKAPESSIGRSKGSNSQTRTLRQSAKLRSPPSRENAWKPCSMKAKECVFSSSITSRPIPSAT